MTRDQILDELAVSVRRNLRGFGYMDSDEGVFETARTLLAAAYDYGFLAGKESANR